MPIEISLNERNFILEALLEGQRLDGRKLDAFRGIDVSFGDDLGVVTVKLGKTKVLVTISAEVAQPFPDRKFEGVFTINAELSPMASPAFETNRQTDLENMLSRILEKSIRRSNALDTESLCILAGQKCWNIRANVHVLDYDGGLVDASCIAIIAALRHFRKPDVSVNGEEVTIHSPSERVPVPLSLLHYPFCATLSFFHQATVVCLDPTAAETSVSEGQMVVTANRHGEICQISKLGGQPTEAVLLLQCMELAVTRIAEISSAVTKFLEADAAKRNTQKMIIEQTAENDR